MRLLVFSCGLRSKCTTKLEASGSWSQPWNVGGRHRRCLPWCDYITLPTIILFLSSLAFQKLTGKTFLSFFFHGSLFQTYHTWRLGLKFDIFPERRWENATVPYHISHKYSKSASLRFSVTIERRPGLKMACVLYLKIALTTFSVLFFQGPVDRETIQTALYTLGLMTCIDFVPYDGEVEDYLLIWPVEEPAG